MVFTVFSSPADTAALFRRIHAAPDRQSADRIIRDASLPRGSSLSLKIKKSETHDQDRINLGKTMTDHMDKIWGVVIHLADAFGSANTWTPACAQIMFKFVWYDDFDECNRMIFLSTSAYSSTFAPRVISDQSRTVKRGDFVCGLLQRPSNIRNIANLVAWDFADIRE